MIIKDRIYGKEEIKEKVLIDLIKSKPIQRLKKINQFGVPDRYYHLKNYSRLEHSLGVMILLKRLGASLDEQIAGLLHDASHTAFSHVYDWVIGSGAVEDAQDKYHKKFINVEFNKILKKYKINPKRIADYKNFKLLEQDTPYLCADRIDYSLREIKINLAKKIVKYLTVKDNKIVFEDQKMAKIYGLQFLSLQMNHWGGLEAVSRYEILSTILKIALKEKIIVKEDFWLTDDELIRKVTRVKNLEIKRLFKLLKNKSYAKLQRSKNVKHKKFRFVDPDFLHKEKVLALSKIDKDFARKLKLAEKENKKGVHPVKF